MWVSYPYLCHKNQVKPKTRNHDRQETNEACAATDRKPHIRNNLIYHSTGISAILRPLTSTSPNIKLNTKTNNIK